MKKRSGNEMLSLRTYSQEISCPSVVPFFINATFPISDVSWTAGSQSIALNAQKFQKGARKK